MYERMLNKSVMPSEKEISEYVGKKHFNLILHLENLLDKKYDLRKELRFPFGNNYGWGYKYSHKTMHLFYVFFEKDCFTTTIQIGSNDVDKLLDILDNLLPKTNEFWDKRYPCGSGGWINYRVENEKELDDILKIIEVKKKPPKNLII
ncbi:MULTISPECIES: DUF3788 family protein [unclassified Clostridioides]|uniref:DUF3788 family protein n=1 Tax=unclassified Clostridioides TaxID=2635829 RepID=UPI001D10A164|nr:DUF3788 family protein [Clostridioides sp. ES-S-0049-03]MCC0675971.1 DUF3788 family protein [Clostridioides sp. ES-W-0018-02]MCC0710950.1 DUF3788 family protein [Clostridioides sp. ES-W-0017-02]UDN57836.1 DUF3788 family protein [Clostridioides sp. ES-S-0010-02]